MGAGGGSAGSQMWAAAEVRRRWRGLLVLGVLAGLSSGLAIAAVAGARRTETSFPRLRTATNASDAVVFPSEVGVFHPDWSKLQRQPYIDTLARWNLLFGSMDGDPGWLIFAPDDGQWFQRVDRPVVVAGRMFDPARADEVVVDENGAAQGMTLGKTFSYQFYEPGKTDLSGKPPAGPKIRFTVVGVVRETTSLLFVTDGMIVTSPGLMQQHRAQIGAIENAHLKLRDPDRDLPKLKRDVPRLLLLPSVPVLDLHEVETRVSTAIQVERAALLAMGLAVAAAGLVFVGQALGRSVALIREDAQTLGAIGLTRTDIATASLLTHALAIVTAPVVAVITALALSPRFPIGFAAKVDPDRGFHADVLVIVPGTVATVAVMAIAVALIARRRLGPERLSVAGRRSLVAGIRRLAPVTVGLGATMALVPSRGRRSTPVRPALAGAVVGVLGLVGTLVVEHGLHDAVSHPARAGVTWDATVAATGSALDPKRPNLLDRPFEQGVTGTKGTAAVTALWNAVVNVDGVGVPVYADQPLRGNVDLAVVDGHRPNGPDEAAIGPETAERLGVGIGDRVTLGRRKLEVVGTVLFPDEVHGAFTAGLLVDWSVLRKAAPPDFAAKGNGSVPKMLVRWRSGVDGPRALAALQRNVSGTDADIEAATVPRELANLGRVHSIPLVLAGFLVFLAVAALLHALVSTLRARRREFAVLRALGFTRRMTASVVATHSTVVAIVGLALGVPLGVASGRSIWAWMAARVPLVYGSPVTFSVVLVVAVGTLVLANLVAAWPAHRASRLPPAEVLRAE